MNKIKIVKSKEEIRDILMAGGVVLMPTDTIYGLIAVAKNEQSVLKVGEIKGRSLEKSYIVLIDNILRIDDFEVEISDKIKKLLSRVWPGPVTVALKKSNNGFEYLRTGHHSIAFRMPKNEYLSDIIKIVGPVIAPSANKQGEKPAKNINEAQAYFGESVDGYFDGGNREGMPSTVISFENEELQLVREGAIPFEWIREIWNEC